MKDFKPLGTLIHGIAASEHLDSSGERISIRGLDISSLPVDGVFNWEHKNDNSFQIVGKILKAKKIFSEKDCEDEHELYFWNKAQAPYVYVMGELFDGVGHKAAAEVAAMLRYDSAARKAGRTGKNVINFSIEGSKLNKEGQEIQRSLGRKVTITTAACNKVAVAEELRLGEEPSDNLDFAKSESGVEIMRKDAKILKLPKLGALSQKPVSASGSQKLPWWASSKADVDKYKQQLKQIDVQDRQKRSGLSSASLKPNPPKPSTDSFGPTSLKPNKLFDPDMSGTIDYKSVKKTLTAGSGLSAPSTKTGGEALASESIEKDIKKLPSFEKFLKFIQNKYPNMSKDESEAMAKYFTARSMIRAEEALEKIANEDLDKSKNVREQRKKIFGTDANAPRHSEKRMKMMQQIRDFVQRRFGMPMVTAEGKRDSSGKIREDKDNQPAYDVFTPEGIAKEKELLEQYKKKGIKRVDPKPDWRSGRLETQPSPDAAVHEVAHLYLSPEDMTPAMFQEYMDKLWGESQSKYGHMQQKKTSGEIQPMAVENPIRRELGLPANRATKPVKQNERALDYEGDRFVEGKDSKGRKVFYDRQSRLMTPETRERVEQVREGSLKFHPEIGWFRDSSPDALINLRGRGKTEEAKIRAEQRYKPASPKKMAASEKIKTNLKKR
jgi:hypothetical protein